MLFKKIFLKKLKQEIKREDLKNKLYNILMNKDVIESINNNIDVLLEMIPEIKDMIGFPHNHPHHHLDVWNHTLLALSLSDMNFDIRLALLLHDIGKPHSYQDKEVRHFKGHPKKSSVIANNILKRLNFNDCYIKEMCYLIEKHDTAIKIHEIRKNCKLEYKRYLIQYADTYAHKRDMIENRVEYLIILKYVFGEYFNLEEISKIKIK